MAIVSIQDVCSIGPSRRTKETRSFIIEEPVPIIKYFYQRTEGRSVTRKGESLIDLQIAIMDRTLWHEASLSWLHFKVRHWLMMMMLFGSFRIYLLVCIERQRRRQSVATKLTLEASLGSTISSGSGAYGGQLVAGLALAGNGVCLIKCTPFPKNRTTLAFSSYHLYWTYTTHIS